MLYLMLTFLVAAKFHTRLLGLETFGSFQKARTSRALVKEQEVIAITQHHFANSFADSIIQFGCRALAFLEVLQRRNQPCVIDELISFLLSVCQGKRQAAVILRMRMDPSRNPVVRARLKKKTSRCLACRSSPGKRHV